ncbi:hypothetical protein PV341_24925, partial [Streptomyces sp. PA03-1a]|nr:hypothetical protein [Streptomyces sp. PA03-1a]
PGYGYPQQPTAPQPAPGYGYPQQPGPYGQQSGPYAQQPGPYGQQPGAWGAPPPPSGGKGKIIGIVVGVVVAVAVIGGGILALTGSGGSGGDHKLAMPATLLDGQYTKSGNDPGLSNGETGDDTGIDDATTVSGNYKKGATEQLIVTGAYGDVSDPGSVLDKMLAAFTSKAGSSGGEAPKEVHPTGFDGDIMKCGTIGSAGVSFPYCAWADDSTVAMAMDMNVDITGATEPPSLSEWADSTVKIRDEVRVKK